MTAPGSILEIRNLRVKRGGAPVLHIPDLSVREREVLCLIGPNGAGKSTLLLALSRLLKSFQGEIVFRGEPVASHGAVFSYRRHIAMAFQDPLLFDATVFDNVASGLRIRGLEKNEISRTAEQCMERFGIGHLADRSARKLSGGEAQRTSLARAFAVSPEIIFLDEPFSSLDPPSRMSLIDDLERVLRETRITAVVTTHDQMEAVRLSDRIAVMKGGKILQIGAPAEVMNNPVDEFVASFVGMETVLEGTVSRSDRGMLGVSVFGRDLEAVGFAEAGTKVLCFIRPENVVLSTGKSKRGSSARNTFRGRITRITPAGGIHKIHVDCGFPLVAVITNVSRENLALEPGMEVTASFKATGVHVIGR